MNIKEPIANMTFGILICIGLICAMFVIHYFAVMVGFGVVSLLGLNVTSGYNAVGYLTMFFGALIYAMGWLGRKIKEQR